MKKLLCIVFLAFIFLAACNDEKEVHDNESKDSGLEQKSDSFQVPEEYENMYPLTGIGTDEVVNNRMVGVMVNNHTKARPQTGLSKADIVFEMLAEGKITRFLALFQSEMPDVVGPVRSAREYYFELANDYNAIYVYHGAAGFVNDMIEQRGIDHLNGSFYDNDGVLFKREPFRKAPHNSYLQLGYVYEKAEAKGYDTKTTYEPLPFLSEGEQVAGEPGNHVKIVYSDTPTEIVEFDYNKRSQAYTRYSDQEKTIELESEEAIQASNVFIIETHHEVIDDAGRRAIDLQSGGDAYLLQKGVVQELRWENRNGRIVPMKDGKEVAFAPGKTWINVIPTEPGIKRAVTISNE